MKVKITNKKTKVKISYSDVFSLDDTLAKIIHPALIKFKKENKGFCHINDKDVPKELRSKVEPFEEDYAVIKLKYNYVIDEMIFAFGSKLRCWESDYSTGVWDMHLDMETICPDTGLSRCIFVKGPKHTQVTDKKALKKCKKRIANGFQLFGIYYEGLWI